MWILFLKNNFRFIYHFLITVAVIDIFFFNFISLLKWKQKIFITFWNIWDRLQVILCTDKNLLKFASKKRHFLCNYGIMCVCADVLCVFCGCYMCEGFFSTYGNENSSRTHINKMHLILCGPFLPLETISNDWLSFC